MTTWGLVTTPPRRLQAQLKPVELHVSWPEAELEDKPLAPSLAGGIRTLYQKCHFYDVFLVCGKSRFPAHQAVLAGASPRLRELLLQLRAAATSEQPEQQAAEDLAAKSDDRLPELVLEGSYSAATLSTLLDFIYGLGEYSAASDEANVEVLGLAKYLELPALKAHAARWLAQHLTVANAIPMLATCEEFELREVSEQIKDQLTSDTQTLLKVTQEVSATKHPIILQDLLMRMATRQAAPVEPAAAAAAPSLTPEKREAPPPAVPVKAKATVKRAKTSD